MDAQGKDPPAGMEREAKAATDDVDPHTLAVNHKNAIEEAHAERRPEIGGNRPPPIATNEAALPLVNPEPSRPESKSRRENTLPGLKGLAREFGYLPPLRTLSLPNSDGHPRAPPTSLAAYAPVAPYAPAALRAPAAVYTPPTGSPTNDLNIPKNASRTMTANAPGRSPGDEMFQQVRNDGRMTVNPGNSTERHDQATQPEVQGFTCAPRSATYYDSEETVVLSHPLPSANYGLTTHSNTHGTPVHGRKHFIPTNEELQDAEAWNDPGKRKDLRREAFDKGVRNKHGQAQHDKYSWMITGRRELEKQSNLPTYFKTDPNLYRHPDNPENYICQHQSPAEGTVEDCVDRKCGHRCCKRGVTRHTCILWISKLEMKWQQDHPDYVIQHEVSGYILKNGIFLGNYEDKTKDGSAEMGHGRDTGQGYGHFNATDNEVNDINGAKDIGISSNAEDYANPDYPKGYVCGHLAFTKKIRCLEGICEGRGHECCKTGVDRETCIKNIKRKVYNTKHRVKKTRQPTNTDGEGQDGSDAEGADSSAASIVPGLALEPQPGETEPAQESFTFNPGLPTDEDDGKYGLPLLLQLRQAAGSKDPREQDQNTEENDDLNLAMM